MVMIYEHMVEEYRKGRVEDIRTYDFKFSKWVWSVIKRIMPLTVIHRPIDVGVTRDGVFWTPIDFKEVRYVGFTVGVKYSKKAGSAWKVPIYKKVEIRKSDYVFCIDQLNNLSTRDKLEKTLENLMDYSSKYVVLSCWALDVRVPDKIECRKRYYWNFEDYVPWFENRGFHLVAKAVYTDAINIVYVFERKF